MCCRGPAIVGLYADLRRRYSATPRCNATLPVVYIDIAEHDEGGAAMETWDAIRARRNVRSYRTDAVPATDLDRIAEAGWRAPSASNRQHWDFVVVTDPDQLRALSEVWRGARHIAEAPAAIALVVPEPADDRTRVIDQYDLGQATLAMAIAAADLG